MNDTTTMTTDTIDSVLAKITQWGKDHNIIGGATAQAQVIKFTEEMGEVAEGITLNDKDLIKDGVGDCVVVLTMIAGITGVAIKQPEDLWLYDSTMCKYVVQLGKLSHAVGRNNIPALEGIMKDMMNLLTGTAQNYNLTLLQCVQKAYDQIKDREGIMLDGIFIKSTDPLYEQAVNTVEMRRSIDAHNAE